MVASSVQEAALQSGPPQPVGTARRLVLPSVERSVRWGASLLHHRRHVTANLVPDLDEGTGGLNPQPLTDFGSAPPPDIRRDGGVTASKAVSGSPDAART